MPAIEYGSYYWCVLLDGENGSPDGAFIYLHADEVSIDGGSLIFKSAGRRPAGTEPNAKEADSPSGNGTEKSKENSGNKNMIYMAFAPGSWKMFYAAKLQDGSPASVEHWSNPQSGSPAPRPPADRGASGYVRQGVV
jgi:hypothetical protein